MGSSVFVGVLWFLVRLFVWVLFAHAAVNAAAILNNLELDDPKVEEARMMSGVFIAAVYAFMGGRGGSRRG